MNRLLHTISAVLFLIITAVNSYADENPDWILNTLKQSHISSSGDRLTFVFDYGDIRIKAADTDKIQVTAIAQYDNEDPRLPQIKFEIEKLAGSKQNHVLRIVFKDSVANVQDSWSKRRIDVGILVPKNIDLDISAKNGLIETKKIESAANLKAVSGHINYYGSGYLTAYSESGNITARINNTSRTNQIKLSTLTGDIRCLLLEGASAEIRSQTHNFIASDFSTIIKREPHSTLKSGYTTIGKGNTKIKINSQNGSIRLQGLLASESNSETDD